MNGLKKFDLASNAFVEWFNSQPETFLHPELQLKDLSDVHRGRGLVATSDIPADTKLFVIPRQSVLSVENSQVVHEIPQFFEARKKTLDEDDEEATSSNEGIDLDDLPDPWLELIVALIYEYLHRDTSKWKPYLDILPKQLDTLIYWDDAELGELQASAILEKVGKDEADETFRDRLLPVIKENPDVFYPEGAAALSDEELVALAHRMGSIIMAYAFDLEKEDIDNDSQEDDWVLDLDGLLALGLVPMADMLNADAEFNAHLNHEDSQLTMASLRPIKAGEEIINYYGPLPNSELLRRYGYTSVKHGLFDVVEIPWTLIRQAILDTLGPDVELPSDDEIDESFVLERANAGPDETGVNNSSASFVEFPEELEDQVAPILAPLLKIKLDDAHELSEEEQERLGDAFLDVMARAIAARLKQYATSVAEDQALLKLATPGSRGRKAIDVRLGEKLLLQEALDFASHARNGTVHGDVESESVDERPTKKQKTEA